MTKLLVFFLKKMSKHECITCTGNKYDGANVKCQLCLRPSFIECLEKANIKEVIDLIKIISPSVKPNSGTRMPSIIQRLINDSSVFVFICTQCKNKNSLRDVISTQSNNEKENKIKQLQSNEVELKTKLNRELETVTNLMSSANDLEHRLQNEIAKNTQLNDDNIKYQNEIQQSIMNIGQMADQIEQLKQQLSERGENMETEFPDDDTLNSLKSVISNQMEVLTKDVEARIKLECDKIKNDILNTLFNSIEKSPKRKRSNASGVNSSVNSRHNALSIDNPSNQNATNTQTFLKPPNDDEMVEDRGYEIHVSQFHKDSNEEDIVAHITTTAKIDSSKYRVIKLTSKKAS